MTPTPECVQVANEVSIWALIIPTVIVLLLGGLMFWIIATRHKF